METKTQLSTTDLSKLKGKITISALKPRTQLPVTARPMTDSRGMLYTGQGEHGYYEMLTEDDKKRLPFVFDYNTAILLEDGKVFDLDNNPYDIGVWKWLATHPYLAPDKFEAENNSGDARFYIVNPQKEASNYLDKTEKTDEARPAVRNLSRKDQERVAEALGLNAPSTFSQPQLLTWLLKKADTDPTSVLDTINPQNKAKVTATIFFKDAVRWKVIERLRDGAFYFGGEKGISLGLTDDMVINYLLNPENVERVKVMKSLLTERTKVNKEKDTVPVSEEEHVV